MHEKPLANGVTVKVKLNLLRESNLTATVVFTERGQHVTRYFFVLEMIISCLGLKGQLSCAPAVGINETLTPWLSSSFSQNIH